MKTLLTTLFGCLTLLFLVAQNEIVEAEFYINEDPGFGNATPIDLTSAETINETLNASFGGLETGKYFAYVRVKGENDNWSLPLKMLFQVEREALADITAAEWYIGVDPGFGSATSIDISAGQTVEDLVSTDTDGLMAGRDFAYLRFQNANGSWSIPLKKGFMVNDKFPLDVVAAEYFIDEDPGFGMGIPVAVNPDHFVSESYLAELSLDLEIGDHFLYTRVQNEEGTWSIQVVRSFSVGTVSTEEEELLNSTKVYPNPATDLLNVENDVFGVLEVRLFDANGKAIDAVQLANGNLDLSGVTSGIYLLQIETEGGRLSRKIVVQ